MNQTVPKQLIFTYELKETKPEITLPIEEEFRFPVAEKSVVEVVQDSAPLLLGHRCCWGSEFWEKCSGEQ